MRDAFEEGPKALYKLFPPAIAQDFLKEYGLTVSFTQGQEITKEILCLSTYWVKCALRVGISEQAGEKIWQNVLKEIGKGWDSKFGFVHVPIDQFFLKMEISHTAWEVLSKERREPILVFNNVAKDLEERGIISYKDQQNILALFLDLVPIEEIGAVAAEIEQSLSFYGDFPF